MKLVRAHTRAELVMLLRYPTFSVPTVIFPTMFFLFFVVPGAAEAEPSILMAFYAGFAVLGVAFFQFGVGTATDRVSPWNVFLRALPLPPRVRFSARVASSLLFALASSSLVVGTALLTQPIHLSAARWAAFAAVLLLGSIPFSLMGLAIGYWLTPRGALPTANLLYLTLAYAGGLWTGPDSLPGPVAAVSPYLPTGQWAELLGSAVTGTSVPPRSLLLAGYAVGFGLLAGWGYRRDEGERYH